MTSSKTLAGPILAALTFCSTFAAHAEIVDIVWGDAGRFERSTDVAAGKFVEACGKLNKGMQVRWSFKADRTLDFNIHYHQGKEVVFPTRRAGVRNAAGTLQVGIEQDYCWMWTNRSATPMPLRFVLER